MNGLTGKGIPIAGTGIVIYGPDVLGPPKVVIREGTFPIGDYQHWVSHHIPVYGISCESFLDVYLQLNGEETNMVLDRVADYIERVPTVTKTTTDFSKVPGSPCLAQFEDDSWYRARIVEDLGDEMYRVYFVDYGNYSNIKSDRLMHCPDDLVDFVEGITHVALHGYTGDESKDEIEALSKYVVETDLLAKVESASFEVKGKTRMLVTLFTADGQPIHSLVQEIKTKRTLPVSDDAAKRDSSPQKEEKVTERNDSSECSDSVSPDLVHEDKKESPLVLIPSEEAAPSPEKEDKFVNKNNAPESSTDVFPNLIPGEKQESRLLIPAAETAPPTQKNDIIVIEKVNESESSADICPDLSDEGKKESLPVLIPAADSTEYSVPEVMEPELSTNEAQLSVVVSHNVHETQPRVTLSSTANAAPPPKIQKLEQFEDAVDSGPVTVPRKSSLTSSFNPASSFESVGLTDPQKQAVTDFLMEKDIWRIEKLNLEKQIEELKQDRDTKNQMIREIHEKAEREMVVLKADCSEKADTNILLITRLQKALEDLRSHEGAAQHIQNLEAQIGESHQKAENLAREMLALKSDCSEKADKNNLLSTRLQKALEELASHEGATQHIQDLEAQSANQLGEISNLRSIINAMQANIYQLQLELEGKKSELESQILFNGELLTKKQNFAKELAGLRSQEAALKSELKELTRNFEEKTEKLVSDIQMKENSLLDALKAGEELKEVKKENEELREHLLNIEQEFEMKLVKARSRGGSLVDVSTFTSRSPGLPPDYEAIVTEQKLAVERLTETLVQIVKTNALESRYLHTKIEHLSAELPARNGHFSATLKHDPEK